MCNADNPIVWVFIINALAFFWFWAILSYLDGKWSSKNEYEESDY